MQRDTTKNHSTRKNLGMQERHFVKVKRKKSKTQTKPKPTFLKVEIISSHTATITYTGDFPKRNKGSEKGA